MICFVFRSEVTVCPNVAGLRRGEVAGFGRKIVDVLLGSLVVGFWRPRRQLADLSWWIDCRAIILPDRLTR